MFVILVQIQLAFHVMRLTMLNAILVIRRHIGYLMIVFILVQEEPSQPHQTVRLVMFLVRFAQTSQLLALFAILGTSSAGPPVQQHVWPSMAQPQTLLSVYSAMRNALCAINFPPTVLHAQPLPQM